MKTFNREGWLVSGWQPVNEPDGGTDEPAFVEPESDASFVQLRIVIEAPVVVSP